LRFLPSFLFSKFRTKSRFLNTKELEQLEEDATDGPAASYWQVYHGLSTKIDELKDTGDSPSPRTLTGEHANGRQSSQRLGHHRQQREQADRGDGRVFELKT